MAKKPTPDELIQRVQNEIEESLSELDDNDYVEAMNQIASFCESCATAKEEDIAREEDEDEG